LKIDSIKEQWIWNDNWNWLQRKRLILIKKSQNVSKISNFQVFFIRHRERDWPVQNLVQFQRCWRAQNVYSSDINPGSGDSWPRTITRCQPGKPIMAIQVSFFFRIHWLQLWSLIRPNSAIFKGFFPKLFDKHARNSYYIFLFQELLQCCLVSLHGASRSDQSDLGIRQLPR